MIENPNVICNGCAYCKQNTKLKELLKRARGLMNYTKDWACSDATEEMIAKINQALGEDKCTPL